VKFQVRVGPFSVAEVLGITAEEPWALQFVGMLLNSSVLLECGQSPIRSADASGGTQKRIFDEYAGNRLPSVKVLRQNPRRATF
jgi:hypothetical protein